MEIRNASWNDISALADLMVQLGYPTTVDQFRIRFQHINGHPDYHTLVADIDGKVVGMVGLNSGFLFELDGSYTRIVAFVVD